MPCTYFNASEKVCDLCPDTECRLRENAAMSESQYLRAWRKFRHLTLEEVAEAVGTTKAVIQQLETGRMTLSQKWLAKIAPVLGTTPGFLLDHSPEDLPTSVLETWAAIPEADRPRALQVLQAFMTGTDG